MVVAHRGASGEAPENTIPAFNLAWKQGADAIEGDFHLTKDGQGGGGVDFGGVLFTCFVGWC